MLARAGVCAGPQRAVATGKSREISGVSVGLLNLSVDDRNRARMPYLVAATRQSESGAVSPASSYCSSTVVASEPCSKADFQRTSSGVD